MNGVVSTGPRRASRLAVSIVRRFAVLVTGYGFMQGSVIVFDHLLYGAASAYFIYLFGPMNGATVTLLVMAPLSAIVCLLFIKGYDYLKIDWLGFETIRSFKEKTERQRPLARFTRYLLRKGDWVAFVALSLLADPFVTTVYLRRGTYSGMAARDHRIFWASVVVSNAFWTVRWAVVIELAVLAFGRLPEAWRIWLIEIARRLVAEI